MLVDDDIETRNTITSCLEDACGFEVYEAGTGRAAIETVQKIDVDIILLDYFLPDIKGTQVLTMLKLFTSAPVLLITGYAQIGCVAKFLNAGGDGYLEKPIVLDGLCKHLLSFINQHALREV